MKLPIKLSIVLALVSSQILISITTSAQQTGPSEISPLGISWGFDYGNSGEPPVFMNYLHDLGVNSTKVYLFWNQIEPTKGKYDWTAIDVLISQLSDKDELLIAVYSASTWGTTISTTLLPPSPAISGQDYYEFIYKLVKRAKGKVKYWQNDCEPSNLVYWGGSREEYVAQTKTFYRAVKDADPNAMVVLGGYDGLFNPPGLPEMPNQKHGLEFFEQVIEEASGYFDVFDLRLYANPYTIPERVKYFQEKLSEIPIICTEYNGPGFMEFPVNRQYGGLIARWSNAYATQDTAAYYRVQEDIQELYDKSENLAPETRLFLEGISEEYDKLYEDLQAADLVIRNVLALSSGIKKTFYWDFWHDTQNKNDLMTIMYGKNKMADYENGVFKGFRPLAEIMKRFSNLLADIESVTAKKISDDHAVQCYSVMKSNGYNFLIVWEKRSDGLTENLVPKNSTVSVQGVVTEIKDVFGNPVLYEQEGSTLTLPLSSSPVYVYLK